MTAVIVHADDINREHQLARRHANDAIKHAIRCGELLIQKKAELPHGTFTSWIVANCKFKQATANNYMRAAQNPNALGNSIRHLFPSGRPGAAAARAATKATEPDYLKQAADAFGVSVNYVRRAQAIKQRDPALADKILAGSMTIRDAEKIIETKVVEVPKEDERATPENGSASTRSVAADGESLWEQVAIESGLLSMREAIQHLRSAEEAATLLGAMLHELLAEDEFRALAQDFKRRGYAYGGELGHYRLDGEVFDASEAQA